VVGVVGLSTVEHVQHFLCADSDHCPLGDVQNKRKPLHFAALYGHSKVVAVLLKNKSAVVDVRDRVRVAT
jgi:hypothetical protein